ncbi:hypothetical protein FB45DRAFT_1060234 [Roridomyces roridus]|uniref:CCZ1/INTU/HSP4 first Longin domain-containing protein n=1 Tax=Roridomyces roridus TaxID=1738132 RepID=A0AAD7BML9_9AGAR|nr:hypothetical protein FB45DRAFT_1060234 [Roridomyces roridus]
MSRVAANLSYLTIYNPTLRPSGDVATDDEDAEEQAHILFYTSKERAVSRDRMLRQVGLAKALISFSEFQGVNVAKTPRPPVDKGKGKGKEKNKAEQPVVYDYHEFSVHDVALQTDIMRGYEKFKLRHGSFSSILSSSGQEALELQLERFFTIWAWSWDLEAGPEFREHLGPPLHPLQMSLVQSLDEFTSRLPDEPLYRHVLSDCPLQFPSIPSAATSALFSPPPLSTGPDDSTIKAQKSEFKREDDSKMFLGMNLDAVKMDMPKWNWPGYLTFGKGAKRPPELLAVTPMNEDKGNPDTPDVEQTADFEVDRSALEDAMISERIPAPPEKDGDADAEDGRSMADTIKPPKEGVEDSSESLEESESTPLELEPAQFSCTTVHLATTDDAQATQRQKLFYLIRDRILVAVLGFDGPEPDPSVAAEAAALAVALQENMDDEALQSTVEALPSAAKILQPKDRYVISASQQFAISSTDFDSHSGHLYNARQMLRGSEPDISEVFSRGQNPQHWHVGRRGLGTEQGAEADEEVYMEVFRKEASLTDVDNALANAIRKSRLTS